MPTDSSPSVVEPSSEWIERHYGRIHRAAWVMTGDAWEAEDLAQETFVVAIDRWHRFRRQSSESTWLYGILMRLDYRRRRTLSRMQRRLREYWQQSSPTKSVTDPKIEFFQQQWRQSVWAEVANLPRPQRDAMVLRYAEELSYEEIAGVLGCAVGTAKSRVHHAVKRLRDQSELDQPMPRQPQLATVTSNAQEVL